MGGGREKKLKVQVYFVFSSGLTFLTGKKRNMEMEMLLISASTESECSAYTIRRGEGGGG